MRRAPHRLGVVRVVPVCPDCVRIMAFPHATQLITVRFPMETERFLVVSVSQCHGETERFLVVSVSLCRALGHVGHARERLDGVSSTRRSTRTNLIR